MSLIAYPPVYDAKRIVPVRKAFTKARQERVRSAKSLGYTKEFIKQAALSARLAEEARNAAAKVEARRLALLKFKHSGMPEWARQIVEETATRHGICVSEIADGTRKYKVVRVRNEAIYLVKARKPMLSSSQLGRWFDRDHTTILHALASHSDATGAPALVGYNLTHARERNRQRAASHYRQSSPERR